MLAALAEVLLLLGRVDLVEPDLGQTHFIVEERQGIAIGHTDQATRDAFSMDMNRYNQAEQGDELNDETRPGVKPPSSPNEVGISFALPGITLIETWLRTPTRGATRRIGCTPRFA